MESSEEMPSKSVENPRVARTRAAVLAAGKELLLEHGVHSITVEDITRRTGIAKTTIYRHWPSKAELVLGIVAEQAFTFPDPDTGDALEDLRLCLSAFSRSLAEPSNRVALLGVLELAARDPEAAALHHEFQDARRDPLFGIFARGVDSGRIPSDMDAQGTLELLAGPVLMRALLIGEALDDIEIARNIDRVINPRDRGA